MTRIGRRPWLIVAAAALGIAGTAPALSRVSAGLAPHIGAVDPKPH